MKTTLNVNLTSPVTTAIVAILMGIIMLAKPGMVLEFLVTIVGCGLIVWGALPLVYSVMRKQPIPSVPVLMLIAGIVVLVFAGFLMRFVAFVFGVVLILAAIQQLNMLTVFKSQGYIVDMKQYIFPAVVLLLGVLTFINPFRAESAVVMLFGAALLFFGITTLITKAMTHKPQIKE